MGLAMVNLNEDMREGLRAWDDSDVRRAMERLWSKARWIKDRVKIEDYELVRGEVTGFLDENMGDCSELVFKMGDSWLADKLGASKYQIRSWYDTRDEKSSLEPRKIRRTDKVEFRCARAGCDVVKMVAPSYLKTHKYCGRECFALDAKDRPHKAYTKRNRRGAITPEPVAEGIPKGLPILQPEPTPESEPTPAIAVAVLAERPKLSPTIGAMPIEEFLHLIIAKIDDLKQQKIIMEAQITRLNYKIAVLQSAVEVIREDLGHT